MPYPESYHLYELEIATSSDDPRRIMPQISADHHRILDVGCGAGQTLIASALPAGAMACGVDAEYAALSLGRRLSDRIYFVCASGEALPFRSATFDFVISRVALPYMNVPRAVGQCARVLRPGGSVWLVLNPASLIVRQAVDGLKRTRPKAVLLALCGLLSGALLHIVGAQPRLPFRRHRYESFQTFGGMTRILRRAGFIESEVGQHPFFVVTAKKCWLVSGKRECMTGNHRRTAAGETRSD